MSANKLCWVAGTLWLAGAMALAAKPSGEVVAWNELGSLPDAMVPTAFSRHFKEHLGSLAIFTVPKGMSEDAFVRELKLTGAYQNVEPNVVCEPCVIPSDPGFAQQWHHFQISTPRAWDISKGAGVTIAIVDTGIDLTHPEFAGRILPGYNAVSNRMAAQGGDLSDVSSIGHGTMVAGVAAAALNGTGVVGVAPEASILPIRVSNNAAGTATLDTIIRGIQVAANLGAKVINVSFTGVNTIGARDAGRYAAAAGSVVVWASGNDGAILTNDWEDVLVVGATDQNDARAAFSGTSSSAYGSAIDLVAPGTSVYTTTKRTASNPSGFTVGEGTSLAAPLVAGAIALIRTETSNLLETELMRRLLVSTSDAGTPGNDDVFGMGRINIGKSVAWPRQHLRREKIQLPPPFYQNGAHYSGVFSDGTLIGSERRTSDGVTTPYVQTGGVTQVMENWMLPGARLNAVIHVDERGYVVLRRGDIINFDIAIRDPDDSVRIINFPLPPGITAVRIDDDVISPCRFDKHGNAYFFIELQRSLSDRIGGVYFVPTGSVQAEYLAPPDGFESVPITNPGFLRADFAVDENGSRLVLPYQAVDASTILLFELDLSTRTYSLANPFIETPIGFVQNRLTLGFGSSGVHLVSGSSITPIDLPSGDIIAPVANRFGEGGVSVSGFGQFVIRPRGADHGTGSIPIQQLLIDQPPATDYLAYASTNYWFTGLFGTVYRPIDTFVAPVTFNSGEDPITVGTIPPVVAVTFLDETGQPYPGVPQRQLLDLGSTGTTEAIMLPPQITGRFKVFLECNETVTPGIPNGSYLSRIYPPGSASLPRDAAASIAQIELYIGDINGDNEVGPGDFALLAQSFGSFLGDANFNRKADVDGDDEVGPGDFAILAENFGLIGDSL